MKKINTFRGLWGLQCSPAAILRVFGMAVLYFAKKTDVPIFFLYYPLPTQYFSVSGEISGEILILLIFLLYLLLRLCQTCYFSEVFRISRRTNMQNLVIFSFLDVLLMYLKKKYISNFSFSQNKTSTVVAYLLC